MVLSENASRIPTSLRASRIPTSLRASRIPTSPCALPPPGYLSRFAQVDVSRGQLPHWDGSGVATFVTMRLGDALPEEKLAPWRQERATWREAHPEPWDTQAQDEYATRFLARIEKWLDVGHGSCVLRDVAHRRVVEDALRHYDGERYVLYAYVVMPNHVHVLFMPNEGETAHGIIRDLKHFTSHRLKGLQTWSGDFWQREYWDTLVRSAEHFQRIRRYVVGNNPESAYDAYAQILSGE